MSSFKVLDAYSALRKELNLLLAQELSHANLGHKQMQVLFVLKNEDSSMTHLAQCTLSDPAAMSRTVAALEKSGLVRRAPAPEDQRKSIVALTAKGRQAATKAEKIRTAIGRKLEQSLAEQERETLARLTNKIVAHLKSHRS